MMLLDSLDRASGVVANVEPLWVRRTWEHMVTHLRALNCDGQLPPLKPGVGASSQRCTHTLSCIISSPTASLSRRQPPLLATFDHSPCVRQCARAVRSAAGACSASGRSSKAGKLVIVSCWCFRSPAYSCVLLRTSNLYLVQPNTNTNTNLGPILDSTLGPNC